MSRAPGWMHLRARHSHVHSFPPSVNSNRLPVRAGLPVPRALTEPPHPVQPRQPQTPHPTFELPPFGMQVERGLLGAEAAKVGSGVG